MPVTLGFPDAFFPPLFLPCSNKTLLKTPREAPVLFPKYLFFSCRLEVWSVCSSVYACGWRSHFRIAKTVTALTFFPSKSVKSEFSLLKDLGSAWNRGFHIEESFSHWRRLLKGLTKAEQRNNKRGEGLQCWFRRWADFPPQYVLMGVPVEKAP